MEWHIFQRGSPVSIERARTSKPLNHFTEVIHFSTRSLFSESYLHRNRIYIYIDGIVPGGSISDHRGALVSFIIASQAKIFTGMVMGGSAGKGVIYYFFSMSIYSNKHKFSLNFGKWLSTNMLR